MDSEQYSLFETLDSLEKLSDVLSSPTLPPVEEETEVLHICDGCSYQTDSLSEFVIHVEVNAPHQHSCPACNNKYRVKSSLNRHIASVHKNRKYQSCDACQLKTISVESLQQHKFAVHLTNVYSCLTCGYSYRKREEFAQHLKSHPSLKGVKTAQKIEKKPVQEPRKEAPPSGAKLIYVDANSEPSFKCSNCEYKSTTRNILQRHYMRHHTKTFKCELCPFAGSNKIELLKHTNRLHGKEREIIQKSGSDNVYVCDICFVVKRSFEESQKHQASH